MGRGPALIGGEVDVAATGGGAAAGAAVDGHAEEPHARLDDLGQVGDRGLLDALEGELAAAVGAGRLGDGDLDGRLGERLGSRGRAPRERPLARLAAGPLGLRDAHPLGERRRLPLAGALEGLDLGAERLDQSGLLEDQGHQLVASQLGEVRYSHGGNVRN